MISDLINTFLANFKYLNTRGHRSGCLFVFADRGLTTGLEKNARQLRNALTALAQKNDISEEEKGNTFYDILHQSFEQAELLRAEHGHPLNKRKSPPINMLDQDGQVNKNYWVRPKKPAKFERQLVQGLTALQADAAARLLANPDPVVESFMKKCEALSNNISDFEPHERCVANAVHRVGKRR
jgi:ABC-type Zn2+ transport system substrate-binding protein/surface adhesin